MSEKCEMLANCGFFKNFSLNSETIKQGWTKMYCDDKKKSERCERKKIRLATGKPPADNMSPTGKML